MGEGKSLEEMRRRFMVRRDAQGNVVPKKKSPEEKASQGAGDLDELATRGQRKTGDLAEAMKAVHAKKTGFPPGQDPKSRTWLWKACGVNTESGLPDAELRFSKYKGKTLSELARDRATRGFLRWITRSVFPDELQQLCERWLEYAVKGGWRPKPRAKLAK